MGLDRHSNQADTLGDAIMSQDPKDKVPQQETPRFVSLLTKNTFAMVLAGGRGSRLMHLTDWRAKPAVPFGGKFRIIDFPLSNCINSGIRRIGVVTQYKAHSLILHIQRVIVKPVSQADNRGWTKLIGGRQAR